mmetsp:Transcript_3940/g.5685  ORF Transcript_3940/g.5685 Transcript_3940/m.5685 type:complete len:330 (+) Transcript_3940:87-1076(+)
MILKEQTSENSASATMSYKDDDDVTKIFPQKLMDMLAEPSNNDAIAWLPHGKSFVIKDREKFSDTVLPKYFRKTKYASFTRKLNRWNFKRVAKGADVGAYYHEFFQRDNEAMCIQMYCKNDRFKFATTPGKTRTLTPKIDSVALNHSINNNVELPSPFLNLPAQQGNLIPPLVLSKLLAPAPIDPATQLRAILVRQQQLQQAQLSLMKNNNNPDLAPNAARQMLITPPPQLMVQQLQQQKHQQLQQRIQQLQFQDQNRKSKQQQEKQMIFQQQQQNLQQLQKQLQLQEETKKQQQQVSQQIALLQQQLAILEMQPKKETIKKPRRASAA